MGVKDRYEQRYSYTSDTNSNSEQKNIGTAERYRLKAEEEEKRRKAETAKRKQEEEKQKAKSEKKAEEVKKPAESESIVNPWVVKKPPTENNSPMRKTTLNTLTQQNPTQEKPRNVASDFSKKTAVEKEKANVEQQNQTRELAIEKKINEQGISREEAEKQYANEYNRELNRRRATRETLEYEKLGREHPVIGSAMSTVSNLGSVAGLAELGKAAFDKDYDFDPNSKYLSPQRITEALRSGASKNIDSELGQFAYNTGMSIADMFLSQFVTAPVGRIAGAATSKVASAASKAAKAARSLPYATNMAVQSASSTAKEAAERGMSDKAVVAEATASGAITLVFSMLGFDNVFSPASASTISALAKQVVKGAASEGLEEGVEEASNIIIDTVIGAVAKENSAYKDLYNQLIASGNTPEEAQKQTIKSLLSQVGMATASGALSGGFVAGVEATPGYVNQKAKEANAIKNNLFANEAQTENDTSWENPQKTQPISSETAQANNIPVEEPNAVTSENTTDLDNLDEVLVDESEDNVTEPEKTEPKTVEADGFIFEEDDIEDFDSFLDSINAEKPRALSETISTNRAVATDPNATPEQRNTAQSNVIKAEYDAEAYSGIKGEITERKNSGMGLETDILIDPIGTKVSAETQAERKIVEIAKNKFGRTVQFVDDIKGSNGFLKDGIIYISRNAESVVTTVFGHEFAHTLEGTTEYRQLLSHMKTNDAYLKSKMQEFGVDWNGLVDLKKAEYASALGKQLSTADAEMELIADAIGSEFFSDYEAMLNLATQNRSVFQRLKQWFERNFTNTLTRKMSESKAEKQTYKLLLRAEQAAKSRSESQSKIEEPQNVGTKFSAKKSDIVKAITEDYGFSDTSAQNLFSVAASMRKYAGSKADLNELLMNIANAVTKAKNGTVSDSDIDGITKLLADNATMRNDDFLDSVAEPLKFLKNLKISISQRDIPDLEDSFSNIRRKAFPYTNIVKEGGILIDDFYKNSLAKNFPEWFPPGNITPSAQLKAVTGFIEYVKENRIINTYAKEDAYLDLRDRIATTLSVPAQNSSTYVTQLIELCKKYGELKNNVPVSTDGKTRVRRTAASVNGTEAVQGNTDLRERFAKEVVNGKFNYEVQLQGKEAADYINAIKSAPDVAQAFETEYQRCYDALSGKNPSPEDVLHASALLPLAAEYLTEDNFINYTSLIAEVGTRSGQIISALRYIGQMNGMQRLKMVERKIAEYNQKMSGKYADDKPNGGTFDENGQMQEDPDDLDPSTSVWFNTRKADKFTPIAVPSDLKEQLVKAKTKEEADAIIGKIDDYVSSQMNYSFWDKLNAWRYFAMLSNPKTWIKNFVGNTAMLGVSRARDITAVAIGKPTEYLTKKAFGKGFTYTNPQTVSVRKSAEAKQAAKILMANDNTIERLFSGQNKWSGKSGMQLMQQQNALSNTPVLKNLVTIEEKALNDQPFRLARAKSVLAQSIHANVKNGKIKDIDKFMRVALNQNTEDISNGEKIEYKRLYDAFCKAAASEGDQTTFRDENKLINDINKFKQNHKVAGALVEGAVPFLKTPANIVKRGLEYNPLGLVATLTKGTVDLKNGKIDANQYVNNIAKGLTGSATMAIGAVLGSLGLLSAGNDDEEDEALRKLENSQEYALNIGDVSITLDWLSPAALSLFSGVKLAESVVEMMSEDSQFEWKDLLSCANVLLDVIGSTADPMFNLTMLDGIDGAIESISIALQQNEDDTGAAIASLVSYCAENWLVQFAPSITSALARTLDDTVRTYYTDKNSELSAGAQSFITTVKKKIPGVTYSNAAYLDIWGQPKSSGNVAERAAENFVTPFYVEKKTEDKATKAIQQFAEDNDMDYSEALPKNAKNFTYKYNGETINLTQEEYEKMSAAIGDAQKQAVEKHLVRGEPVEIEYTYTDIRSSLKSGKSTKKATFKGNLATARNTNGWNETNQIEYSYKTDSESGKQTEKAVGIEPASDEDFRAHLYNEMMKNVAEQAKEKTLYEIVKAKQNKE